MDRIVLSKKKHADDDIRSVDSDTERATIRFQKVGVPGERRGPESPVAWARRLIDREYMGPGLSIWPGTKVK